MTEEWRPVPGYEGRYEVSSLGNVRSLPRLVPSKAGHRRVLRGRELARHTDRDGYIIVQLHREDGGKAAKVHRLVCLAWNGTCPAGHQCAHLNGDRADNRPENLTWATPRENASHKLVHGTQGFGETAVRVSLTEAAVRDIWLSPSSGGVLAHKYGVTPATVYSVRASATWGHFTSMLPRQPDRSRLRKTKIPVPSAALALLRNGATQATVAAQFGVSATTVCRWANAA